MTCPVNSGKLCAGNVMSQIAKSTELMVFDILRMILTASESILIFYLSSAIVFIYRIK
jgi:hypothetical protein